MKKDDYRAEFEEHRKKIELDNKSDEEKIPTRAELHNKKRKPKTKSRLSMINITLALFTLIPIIIIVFVFINMNSSNEASTTTGLSPQVKYETSGKKTSENDNLLLAEKEELAKKKEKELEEKQKKEKELEEKQKKENAEKEKKALEEKQNKERAEKEKIASEEKLKKEQAEKERVELAEKKKAEEAQAEKEKAEKKPDPKIHVVAPKETFYSISVKYYNTGKGADKIKAANGITSNEIYIGQSLIIPE